MTCHSGSRDLSYSAPPTPEKGDRPTVRPLVDDEEDATDEADAGAETEAVVEQDAFTPDLGEQTHANWTGSVPGDD